MLTRCANKFTLRKGRRRFVFLHTGTKHFVDMNEVTDDMRQKPLWQLKVKETERHSHRMAKCVLG